ncbi:hypothetical protein KM043_013896 [Ampulex compressa]|nr:hypothetical protein KM043_013896 [Ampulex compressa]
MWGLLERRGSEENDEQQIEFTSAVTSRRLEGSFCKHHQKLDNRRMVDDTTNSGGSTETTEYRTFVSRKGQEEEVQYENLVSEEYQKMSKFGNVAYCFKKVTE